MRPRGCKQALTPGVSVRYRGGGGARSGSEEGRPSSGLRWCRLALRTRTRPQEPRPAPDSPGWMEPRATRGDSPHVASLEPLRVQALAGWSGRLLRGRRGWPGATPRGWGAQPWEAPRPSSSDQYPFQENTVLLREASSSLYLRRQTAVISFLCRVILLLTHPEKHSPPLTSLWNSERSQIV